MLRCSHAGDFCDLECPHYVSHELVEFHDCTCCEEPGFCDFINHEVVCKEISE
jgi:hypothetical protein